MPRKLFLVDGSNHAFRVFHAMPRSMFADGFPTGALMGFVNMLRLIEREYSPDWIVVVFDVGQPTFRLEKWPEYKGHRPEMPEELRAQWPHFKELVEAWGAAYLAPEHWEADDVIATLAHQHGGPECEVVIVSGDKDCLQLVNDHVKVLDVMKDKMIDREGVIERFGVPPERVIDVLALAGDASDNVPGVPGVGEKTAAGYVQKFGPLENVIQNAAAIGGKRGQAVADNAESARLSQWLVTLKLDCEVPPLEALSGRRDPATLRQLYLKWQFRTHLKELNEAEPPAPTIDRSVYREASSLPDLHGKRVSVDLLDDGGVALAWGERDAVIVPLEVARPVLEDPSIPKTGHDLKATLRKLEGKAELRGIAGDVMLMDYALEPERASHGLDDISLRYLGHTMGAGLPVQGTLFASAPRQTKAETAHVAWMVEQRLLPKLEAAQVNGVTFDVELPLVPVLARVEAAGIAVDRERLRGLGQELQGRIQELERQIYASAGREFTIGSPKQLQEILFDQLGLEASKKTSTGSRSTDADTLELLREEHELPGLILDWRQLTKLKNTYVDALPAAIGPDGRVRTHLLQAVAATGRLSSAEPNLQNIPVRSEEGRRIRECFVAGPGNALVSCDYSQIELRLMAHFCGEGGLMEAFRAGEDVHRRTAAAVFGVPSPSPEQRSAAKAINFGIIYGMGPARLARELRITRAQAQEFMDTYWARYPEVKSFVESAISKARSTGSARTIWGRRRPIGDLGSRNPNDRMAAERLAVNTPIQGSAADLMKLAMIQVDRRLRAELPQVRLVLQVHDELLLEAPLDQVEATKALVREEMENAAPLRVPLRVDARAAANWAEAH